MKVSIPSIVLALALLILPGRSICAVEALTIIQNSNPDYMPYTIDTVMLRDFGVNSKNIANILKVCPPRQRNGDSTGVVLGVNPKLNEDDVGRFAFFGFPSLNLVEELTSGTIIRDYCIEKDTVSTCIDLIGGGHRNDSVFVFRYACGSHLLESLFLTTDQDHRFNKSWEPGIEILYIGDYDDDSLQEVLIYVNAVRESALRRLFCVELSHPMSIRWSLNMAPDPWRGFTFKVDDSLGPGLVLAMMNPNQGVQDDNYSDQYSYFSRIDSQGKLIYNYKTFRSIGSCTLLKAERPNLFYLTHELPLDNTVNADTADISNPGLLSKVDSYGTILKSVQLEDSSQVVTTWQMPFDGSEDMIYVHFKSRRTFVYDTALVLQAISQDAFLTGYIGKTRLAGQKSESFVFRNGIYELNGTTMAKVVSFPIEIGYFAPLAFGDGQSVEAAVISCANLGLIITIKPKSIFDLITVFYHNNQQIILMIMSGLLVAIVLINIFRVKTRKDLIIIKGQKREIEIASQKLKEAQEKLIAAERYKEVRNIAGGIAHSIKNALITGESACEALLEKAKSEEIKHHALETYLGFISRSIEKAVLLSNNISKMVDIQSEYNPESIDVNKVIEGVFQDNASGLNQKKILFKLELQAGVEAINNRRQFEEVILNLLLNAIDALADKKDGSITAKTYNTNADVIIEFHDTGFGIEKNNIDRVFDTFYSTKPEKGTGFGLTICRRIVEMYGGNISVQSEPGQWTRFTIILKAGKTITSGVGNGNIG